VRRRLAVWLVGSALLAATAILVGCAVTAATAPIAVVEHEAFAPGTACDSANCHTQYKHEEPYLGACEKCHNLVDWKQITYTHKDPTFDRGMHPLVGCAMCHTEGGPLPSRACSSCHPEAPHKGWTSCGSCHGTRAWGMRKPLPEGHVSLKGDHAPLECFDCHKAPIAPAKARGCVDCHGSNHGGLTQCQNCHDPETGWAPKPGWSHNDFFVIKGAHSRLECTDCHVDDRFAGTPKVCVGCHGTEHGGLSDCGACHTTVGFLPPTFRHSSVFRLTKGHADLSCGRCHPNKAFARTKNDAGKSCTGCHTPKHGGLTACGQCHPSGDSDPSLFHHPVTFPLLGKHDQPCDSCHLGNEFVPAPSDVCADCHSFLSPHGPGIAGCQNCHTPATTLPNGWEHISVSGHPIALGGHHAAASCTAPDGCHSSLVFSGPTTPCVSCHAGTVPHVGPSDCASCHYPTQWAELHFTHPSIPSSSGGNPSVHTFTDFGPYPAGCVGCHPGTGEAPNLGEHSCTTCH
jgi:hypothetical protein